MNLLLKNNSCRLFFLLFLMMVFNSCVSSKKQVPAPNLNMVNKIQFDTESKEIWAFDFKGQEHYFSKSTKKIIETFNSKTENINAQTIQLYCNYHTSDEILIIGEKRVSVYQAETKVIFDQKKEGKARKNRIGGSCDLCKQSIDFACFFLLNLMDFRK